ncbi:hypothetical protein PT974_04849 [Cladobotryum mycophilum]|uniref:VOC domain-containing protein n=1 Tax=Cladobotryum mycophilum TaxID=491253 RepID=A0ABR0SQB9_9HYPO
MSVQKLDNPPSFYLSLPTTSAESARIFYLSLGFQHIPQYSDADTVALRLPGANANICLMVHQPARFKTFIRPDTEIVDAEKYTEGIYSVAVKSKEEVDGFLAKAKEAGGKLDPFVMPGYGAECGMYTRSWTDLDGHIWEATCMLEGGCTQTESSS